MFVVSGFLSWFSCRPVDIPEYYLGQEWRPKAFVPKLQGKKVSFLQGDGARQVHKLAWAENHRLRKWADTLPMQQFAVVFWLYARLRSEDFLDYLDARQVWDQRDFIRSYTVR